MSRFSTIVSTIAALGTIAATSVTAYKVFDSQRDNSTKQQQIIEDLKKQLQAKTQPPVVIPQPQPLPAAPSPLVSGSASAPPPPPTLPVQP